MNPETIFFVVAGIPKGQPRARARRRGKHASVYHPTDGPDAGWRADVTAAALPHRPDQPMSGAVAVSLLLTFPRPKSHYGTGRNTTKLRPRAPVDHTSKPDADNAAKLILDQLTELGYWHDDAQVVLLTVEKRWGWFGECAVTITPRKAWLSVSLGELQAGVPA